MTESKNNKKVILVTGASSGIGRKCFDHLSGKGHKVYGTSRQANQSMLQLDVNNNESVIQAVNTILQKESRIDVVINNAGVGIAGAIEDTSIDEAKLVFETNLWGVLRVCRAVLPVMRKQNSGCIINMSSLGGLISVPFQGIYSASKWALEGMTEALRMEVQQFGIHVILVEPGDSSTQFTQSRFKTIHSQINPAYKSLFTKALNVSELDEQNGLSPDKVAQLIGRIIRKPKPKFRYSIAGPTQIIAPSIKYLVPQALFEKLIMSHYKILKTFANQESK